MKNGFVLACERTREAVYIDPGDEVDELLATIASERLTTVAILLTHAHVDHVSGVARAKRVLKAPIWLHAADQSLYERAAGQGLLFGLRIEQPPPVDRYYQGDGPWGRFGDYEITVEHTPGKSVRPIEPANNVSPTNRPSSTRGGPVRYAARQTLPGQWPGVCSTVIS